MPAKTTTKRGGGAGAPARRPLTRDRIVREALVLLDEGGLDALTMRRLGERLGVEAMSLYGHVEGKQGLIAGIVELLWEEVAQATDAGSGDWRATLGSLSRRLRSLADRHPDAFSLMTITTSFTEPMLRTYGSALAALRDAGFEDDRAAKALNAVVGYASGYAVMERNCREVAGDRGGDLESLVETVQALPRDLPPELVRVVRDCYACSLDEQFEFGLEALLAGLER